MTTISSYSPAASPDTEFEQSIWCVNGQGLLRTVPVVNGVAGAIVWTAADGTVVVPTGPQLAAATPGACAIAGTVPTNANAVVTRIVTSAAAATAAGLASVSITNTGAANGTVLAAVIKPGETANFSAYLDPVTNVFNRVPAVAYDGTGTTLTVVTQA